MTSVLELPPNPWLGLPKTADFILPEDEAVIHRHNHGVRSADHRFVLDLLPEPFLGSADADVVLLNLNPGFSEADYAAHSHPAFAKACRDMLRHQRESWPFYLLDPDFAFASGAQWWRKRLRCLAEAVGSWEPLGHRLLVIELYGYHSVKFRRPKQDPPSVEYGIALARHAMASGSLVVLMRSKRSWLDQLPELAQYEDFHVMANPQSPYFSPRNCPTAFDKATARLRS